MLKMARIRLNVNGEGAALISDFLLGQNAQGVAEDHKEDGVTEVSAYFYRDQNLGVIIKRLKQYITFIESTIDNAEIGEIRTEQIDRSGWALWKRELKAVRASNKIIIKPPWEQYEPQDLETVIEINPSMAFGTGHHATTRLCIQYIEEILSTNTVESVLDVGCGSGILSIASVKLGAKNVLGLDTDPIAIRETIRNTTVNKALDKCKFFCGYLESVKGSFDLIVANIYIEPLLLMAQDLKSRLRTNGHLIISGIPNTRRDELVRGLSKSGLILKDERTDEVWHAFIYQLS